MDDVITLGLLLDYYGQFLTENQQKAMELHFNEDWSLSEIAEYLGISRQGVYDFIKKGKALLYEFEEKLHLVREAIETKQKMRRIIETCNELKSRVEGEKNKELCNGIIDELNALINDI